VAYLAKAGFQYVLLSVIVASAATMAACSGDEAPRPDEGGSDSADSRSAAANQATATATLSTANPTATALRTATAAPAARSPEPSRADCQDGWLAYVDPDGRYSFCHPSNLTISTTFVLGNRNVVLAGPNSAAGGAFPSIGFESRPQASAPPLNCIGPSDPSPYATDRVTDVAIAGRSLPVCFTHAYRDEDKTDLGYAALYLEYPVSDGGVIAIVSVWHPPDVEAEQEAVMRILNTLRVR
jgi:hypothetical protein